MSLKAHEREKYRHRLRMTLMIITKILGFFALWLCMSIAYAVKPIIVIDPGHEPSELGAIGTCQKNEVEYNDELASYVVKQLSDSYHVILTRQPGQDVVTDNLTPQSLIPQDKPLWATKTSLLARAVIANNNNAQLFIAIHHDAALAQNQVEDPKLCDGHGGKTLSPAYKKNYVAGFNVFVYDNIHDQRTEDSIALADDIGKNLIAMGRTPADYYISPNNGCESCIPIHENLGVWNENLAVLRNTKMPAVLIEAGNIVDAADEAKINNDQYREQFSKAIKRAVDQYFLSHPASPSEGQKK